MKETERLTLLQLALDLADKKRALKIAEETARYFDIIEAGTPLIKACGIGVVKELKKIGLPVLADLKTFDAGRLEAIIASEQGADYATVLAAASDVTVTDFTKTCRERSVKAVADIMGAPFGRVRFLERVGVNYIAVHSGVDEQKRGATPFRLLKRVASRSEVPLMVAGGINSKNIQLAKPYAEIIVVGSAVTSSSDPVETARLLRKAYREE